MLQDTTIDIGPKGEILCHKAGLLAKDRSGRRWISRKPMQTAAGIRYGFVPE